MSYLLPCPNKAEFAIYGESDHPEDDTYACEEHVGELLGTPVWLDKENTAWTVATSQGDLGQCCFLYVCCTYTHGDGTICSRPIGEHVDDFLERNLLAHQFVE